MLLYEVTKICSSASLHEVCVSSEAHLDTTCQHRHTYCTPPAHAWTALWIYASLSSSSFFLSSFDLAEFAFSSNLVFTAARLSL